jgi:flagellar biosynthesis GTPase FlhF
MPNQNRRSKDEELAAAAGFEVRTLAIFFNDRLAHAQLLLPVGPTIDDLVLSRGEAAAEAARAFDLQVDVRRRADEERRKASAIFASIQAKEDGEPPPPNPPRSSFKKHGKLDVLAERDCLLEKYQIDLDAHGSKAGVEVYRWDEPLKLIKDSDVKSPDRDWRERDQQLYERLAKMGSFRQVGGAQTELEDMAVDLGTLRKQQPHFSEVVDLILGQLRLAEVKGTPLRLPPILLIGPPGVGKTHFTFQLAQVLKRPHYRHSLDVSHTSSSLMGSARN